MDENDNHNQDEDLKPDQTGPEGDDAEDTPAEGSALSIAKELLPVSLEKEMKRSYLDYAMSVIVGRALPDVRDGFKPVHRRVLYAMNEIKNTYNNPTKKSARVVGEVLGKYHPHGDSAAYMTLVRMAQPFSLRYPLVFGQGNFGSIDGDSPAAMRYTEVRLQKIAGEMLADINEDTVDFVPNFDNSLMEPTVLPTRLPQLIVNGSSGIAVGMATSIPPHNLRETVAACLYQLEHPQCTIDDIIRLIPAPDFPTGGIIFGLSDVHKGYRTGRGRVVMRARTHFCKESDLLDSKREREAKAKSGRDRDCIIVDEIPYMVNKQTMYEKMHELMRDKKIDGIAEMSDQSTAQIKIVIVLKQGAIPEVVLNNLFKLTQMQEVFPMNMVALVDGQPSLLNLQEMIVHFLAHRREVVTRRTVFRLNKYRAQGHLLEGQAVALSNLDEFIRIIRSAKTPADAAAALYARGWPMVFAEELARRSAEEIRMYYPEDMDPARGLQSDGLYYLTRVQIDNILSMSLRRLTGLEQEKVRSDYAEMMRSIADCLDILAKPERVNAIIADELKALGEEYGDDRRSSIDPTGDPNFDKRDLIPRRDMVVTISRGGYVKSQELADYEAQTRGGKGRKVQEMTKDDEVSELFIANSHDIVLCFSTAGRVYPIDVFELPEGKSNTRGRPIVNLLPLEEGEKISFILPIQGYDDEHYVFMATNRGTVKKTPLSAFRNARIKGIIATVLDPGEELVGVAITDGTRDVMLFSDAGKCVRFDENDVRSMGRASHGVRGMRLEEGQSVISLVVVDDPEKFVLTATEHGYGKRTPVAEYSRHARGTKGLIAISTSERNGRVVSSVLVTEDDEIMLLSTGGKVVRTRASEVSVYSRAAQGVRLINLGDDTLASVRRVAATGDEEVEHLDIEVPEDADKALEEDPADDEPEADEPESGETGAKDDGSGDGDEAK
ncbi:MAG: DNA gyrase subunit A [Burkholderia sp.]|jgi:DNA gyrase subunit A